MLPVQQEAQGIGGADRLDLRAQAAQGVAMDACEQTPVAPLERGSAWREAAAQDPSLRLEGEQNGIDVLTAKFPPGDRTQYLQTARDQIERRISAAFQLQTTSQPFTARSPSCPISEREPGSSSASRM